MNYELTVSQIEWASKHDWYLGTNGNSVRVIDITLERGGEVTERELEFSDFRDLREWAGY